jgi:prevent-host-death family protein
MVRQIDVEKAKAQFAKLVAAAAKGEEIILSKDGKPMVRLVAIPAIPPEASEKKKRGKRKLGQWAKLMTPEERDYYGSDQFLRDWNTMDAEIGRDFEESANRPLEEAGRDFKWDDISSTQVRSSARKTVPRKSVRKRAK